MLFSGVKVFCFFFFLNFRQLPLCLKLMGLLLYRSVSKESACNAGDPVRFLDWEDPLEKEMATYPSVFAWRIPWTEEPGSL